MSENRFEEIVLSGIAVRLPESRNLEDVRRNLFDGVDMVTENRPQWPAGFLGLPTRNGRLIEVDKFDARFFGVHTKLGQAMDPQQRMILEVTFEAMMDAGINPEELRGSRTGVFLGITTTEAEPMQSHYPDLINGYILPGCHRSLLANRISFTFDLKGPSLVLDTACSSTMVALETAVSAIRLGKIDRALVGGSNLLLHPHSSLHMDKMGLSSRDGKCKSFDIKGDGYVRSEGSGIILVQRRSLARRVYATIRNCMHSNAGYRHLGLLYPSAASQELLLQETYSQVGIHPSEIKYFEAHAAGTKAGDPQELNSVLNFVQPSSAHPLLVGSVRSNMGHSEPASGVASLAKMVIAMQAGIIPGNLHYEQPNPDIRGITTGQLKVVDRNTKWEGGIYAMNSFGWGGSNVHTIFESFPKLESLNSESTPLLIPFSGRTEQAVTSGMQKIGEMGSINEVVGLLHGIHKCNIRGHPWRGYAIACTDSNTVQKTISTAVQELQVEKNPTLWFVFSGMGSQAGIENIIQLKPIRESLELSATCLHELLDFDLMASIQENRGDEFQNVTNCFVAIVAIQIAMVDTLRGMGLVPDGFLGHSVGELSCAYLDGCLSREETLLVAYWRGEAILRTDCPAGSMAALGISWEEALLKCPPSIYPACQNTRDGVTVSGPKEEITTFLEELRAENVFVKEVDTCGYAFHSDYIRPAVPLLKTKLEQILGNGARDRSSKWLTTSRGESRASVEYMLNNLVSPVYFAEALDQIPADAVVVEIGPKTLLQAVLRRALPSSIVRISTGRKDRGNALTTFLEAAGILFVSGLNMDMSMLYEPIDYPVSLKTPNIHPLIEWDHTFKWDVPDYTKKLCRANGETLIEISIGTDTYAYLEHHVINGQNTLPGALLLHVVWRAFAVLRLQPLEKLAIELRNLQFHADSRRIKISKDSTIRFLVQILSQTGQFNVEESDNLILSGSVHELTNDIQNTPLINGVPNDKAPSVLTRSEICKELNIRGYNYLEQFKTLQSSSFDGQAIEIEWTENWVTFFDAMIQSRIIASNDRDLQYPVSVEKVKIYPEIFQKIVQNNLFRKGDWVPGTFDKGSDTVKVPGISIHGLKLESMQDPAIALDSSAYAIEPSSNSVAEESGCFQGMQLQDTAAIIVDGLSDVGLELVYWLVGNGAKKFALTSENEPTGYQRFHLNKLSKLGIQVITKVTDMANLESVRDTLAAASSVILCSTFIGVYHITGLLRMSGESISQNRNVELELTNMSTALGAPDHLKRLLAFQQSSEIDDLYAEDLTLIEVAYEAIPKLEDCQKFFEGIAPILLHKGGAGIFRLKRSEQEAVVQVEAGNQKPSILESVGTFMDIPDILKKSELTTLTELGMDSAMTFEMRNMLEREYNLKISIEETRMLSIQKLLEYSASQSERVSGVDKGRMH